MIDLTKWTARGCLQWLAVIIVLVGFLGMLFYYGDLLFFHIVGEWPLSAGVPLCMMGALVIVLLLNTLFPPPEEAGTKALKIKAFSMEFTGPAGPIMLWLACFIGLAWATNYIQLKSAKDTTTTKKAAPTTQEPAEKK